MPRTDTPTPYERARKAGVLVSSLLGALRTDQAARIQIEMAEAAINELSRLIVDITTPEKDTAQ